MLLAFAPVGRHMICAALRAGQNPTSTSAGVLFGRQQAWVLLGHTTPSGWWKRGATDKHNCSNDELRSATQGYLAVDRDGTAGTHLINTTGVDPKVWLETYKTRSGSAGVTVEGVAAYDAVWTWAYALHDLLYTQGVDAMTLTSEAGREQMFDTLAKQDFYGASGRVYFDPVSGDRRGLPVKIENSVDGEEIVVGHFSPESGIQWDSSRPVVWHSSTFLDNGGDKNNGTNYARTGKVYAPKDGRDVPIVPLVYSVVPSVITPKGGKVTINGADFRPGIITVNVGNKICVAPVFESDTSIVCGVPPGVGGPHRVVVNCNGVKSEPHKLLSYFLPHIYNISQRWLADGSRIRVSITA